MDVGAIRTVYSKVVGAPSEGFPKELTIETVEIPLEKLYEEILKQLGLDEEVSVDQITDATTWSLSGFTPTISIWKQTGRIYLEISYQKLVSKLSQGTLRKAAQKRASRIVGPRESKKFDWKPVLYWPISSNPISAREVNARQCEIRQITMNMIFKRLNTNDPRFEALVKSSCESELPALLFLRGFSDRTVNYEEYKKCAVAWFECLPDPTQVSLTRETVPSLERPMKNPLLQEIVVLTDLDDKFTVFLEPTLDADRFSAYVIPGDKSEVWVKHKIFSFETRDAKNAAWAQQSPHTHLVLDIDATILTNRRTLLPKGKDPKQKSRYNFVLWDTQQRPDGRVLASYLEFTPVIDEFLELVGCQYFISLCTMGLENYALAVAKILSERLQRLFPNYSGDRNLLRVEAVSARWYYDMFECKKWKTQPNYAPKSFARVVPGASCIGWTEPMRRFNNVAAIDDNDKWWCVAERPFVLAVRNLPVAPDDPIPEHLVREESEKALEGDTPIDKAFVTALDRFGRNLASGREQYLMNPKLHLIHYVNYDVQMTFVSSPLLDRDSPPHSPATALGSADSAAHVAAVTPRQVVSNQSFQPLSQTRTPRGSTPSQAALQKGAAGLPNHDSRDRNQNAGSSRGTQNFHGEAREEAVERKNESGGIRRQKHQESLGTRSYSRHEYERDKSRGGKDDDAREEGRNLPAKRKRD